VEKSQSTRPRRVAAAKSQLGHDDDAEDMDEDEDESSGADKRPWSGGDDAASGSSDDSYGLGDRKVAQIMRNRLRRAEAMHHQTKPLNKSETAHTLLSLRHLGSMGGAAHAKPSGNTSAYLDGMTPGTVLRGRSGYVHQLQATNCKHAPAAK